MKLVLKEDKRQREHKHSDVSVTQVNQLVMSTLVCQIYQGTLVSQNSTPCSLAEDLGNSTLLPLGCIHFFAIKVTSVLEPNSWHTMVQYWCWHEAPQLGSFPKDQLGCSSKCPESRHAEDNQPGIITAFTIFTKTSMLWSLTFSAEDSFLQCGHCEYLFDANESVAVALHKITR